MITGIIRSGDVPSVRSQSSSSSPVRGFRFHSVMTTSMPPERSEAIAFSLSRAVVTWVAPSIMRMSFTSWHISLLLSTTRKRTWLKSIFSDMAVGTPRKAALPRPSDSRNYFSNHIYIEDRAKPTDPCYYMWIVGSSFLPLGNVLSPSRPNTAPTGRVLLLSVLFANGILAATMYLPSLPAMGRDFAVPADTLPLTLTVYFATFAAGQLVYGPLSDRYGRRPLLLGGLVVMVLGSAACALAGSLTALLWAGSIQGLGAASAMAVGRAIVNDAYDRQKAARATATISASLALAPIIAPLLGGLIEQYLGWRWNFWISGGITAAVLLILMRRLPETHRPSGDAGPLLRGIARAYGFLLTSRAFLTFGLLNLAIFAGLHGFNAGAPAVLIDTFGLSPVLFGILAALGAAGF